MKFNKLTRILTSLRIPNTQAHCEHRIAIEGNDLQWEFKVWAEGCWYLQYHIDKIRCLNAMRCEKARLERARRAKMMEKVKANYGPFPDYFFKIAPAAAKAAEARIKRLEEQG